MTYDEIMRVYAGSNGDATRALYAKLEQVGPRGAIALNLFRACKCSERAKLYRRGPGHKTAAYERKDWSIGNLAKVLSADDAHGVVHGWALDEALRAEGDPHHHIIYVEIPHGQISFHNGVRYAGPDYAGRWDGVRNAAPERICRWCADLLREFRPEGG